tara:strand:+ start:542 stop:826 length:285 start_codon:yes stop_codon:yes gene_type:complete
MVASMSILAPDNYVRRTTSTIPFGYELSPVNGYLNPIPEQIDILKEVAEAVHAGEISLGIGVDWLEAETGRKLSRAGLKKHTDKVYGRLVKKSS